MLIKGKQIWKVESGGPQGNIYPQCSLQEAPLSALATLTLDMCLPNSLPVPGKCYSDAFSKEGGHVRILCALDL